MRYSRYSGVPSLLVFLPVVLSGQSARDNVVPLKNWAAPLYWQPNQVEREAVPQLQFSANAVSTNALTFVAITPCRLVDTRGGAFNGMSPFSGPSIASKGTITIPVQSPTEATTNTAPAPCGAIPSIAQAYSFNLTVAPVGGGAVDYVSLWQAGAAQPYVATLDDPQGAIVSNAAIVPAGTPDGGISVYNAGPATTNVIIDVNGYFAAPTDLNGNTAVGAASLQSNTTGTDNTASGAAALYYNTTGSANTASGGSALAMNTTGNENTAAGAGALYSNTTGSNNTAVGGDALVSNTTGTDNTAAGFAALAANTIGIYNTAIGYNALTANTDGGANTATGFEALQNNTSGSLNTANGFEALLENTMGFDNTATGYQALRVNTTGGGNTANGYFALQLNTTGVGNTANGAGALDANTTACCNTASGYNALGFNTGESNTASGYEAMSANTTGSGNTASGFNALQNNTTGSVNIAIGAGAASYVGGGNSNNIHIGSEGASGDQGVIRIGTVGTQTSASIAGIYGGTPSNPNLLVCVDANGTLGTSGCTSTPSSRRFKEQITDMGDSSSKLLQLRPVTFLYKPEYDDGSHALQYGLIAEEVAELYPDMVGYDKDGQPSSVKYQSLTPMLLNEVQKLEDRVAALEALLSSQTAAAARPAGSF